MPKGSGKDVAALDDPSSTISTSSRSTAANVAERNPGPKEEVKANGLNPGKETREVAAGRKLHNLRRSCWC